VVFKSEYECKTIVRHQKAFLICIEKPGKEEDDDEEDDDDEEEEIEDEENSQKEGLMRVEVGKDGEINKVIKWLD